MVSIRILSTHRGSYGVLAILLLASLSCRADSVVVASSSPHWPAGRVLPTGEVVGLAAGERLTLLTASGRTLVLRGAYAGPVAEHGEDARPGVARVLARLLQGPGQDSSALGATRSLPSTTGPAPSVAPDSHTLLVDVSRSPGRAWWWRGLSTIRTRKR
jgi:hypothetical protein